MDDEKAESRTQFIGLQNIAHLLYFIYDFIFQVSVLVTCKHKILEKSNRKMMLSHSLRKFLLRFADCMKSPNVSLGSIMNYSGSKQPICLHKMIHLLYLIEGITQS